MNRTDDEDRQLDDLLVTAKELDPDEYRDQPAKAPVAEAEDDDAEEESDWDEQPVGRPDLRTRYQVEEGSRTSHCCFTATVVDTWLKWRSLCECIREEDAEDICKALNRPWCLWWWLTAILTGIIMGSMTVIFTR